jgi:hypothetical protein
VSALLVMVAWCLLFALSWPLAVAALVLWPIVWLVSLPFRLVGITLDALFALLRAVLFLPARLLGLRRTPNGTLAIRETRFAADDLRGCERCDVCSTLC